MQGKTAIQASSSLYTNLDHSIFCCAMHLRHETSSFDLQDPAVFMSPSDPNLVPEQAPSANHEQSRYGESARSARLEQLLW